MKNFEITPKDIVKTLDDESKHKLAMQCMLDKTEPEEVLQTICNVVNPTVDFAIDICNIYFETLQGKEYLNMRKKIEKIGGKL